MIEDLLRNRFETLTLDEPPLPSSTNEIVALGRRQLRRRQVATGLTSAVGLSAVAIAAAAVVAPGGTPDRTEVAAGGDQADRAGEAADTDTDTTDAEADAEAANTGAGTADIVPAPPARDLTPEELETAFDTCRAEPLMGSGYDGWEPVAGVRIETDVAAGLPATWVIARRGDDYRADCSLTSDGEWFGGGGEYGVKSTPNLLYALVDGQEGRGVGRYADPVATVTVQYEDEPERKAVLRNGFWFLPYDANRFEPPAEAYEGDRSTPEGAERAVWPDRDWLVEHGYHPDLIAVPLGYTFRGYDADGEIVYDSSRDGPSVQDCYADPTGTEFVGNWADYDDPSECVRTHQWEFQD